MASLVGAVYKGTTKAASATVGATYSKVAGQIPTPTRAIYNLGLGVGPLLESIVSEMGKGKPKPTSNQQTSQDSSKATAEGLRSVAVQISSLSNIMSDLRNIALMQLKENKASNQRLRQLEIQRRFGEQEDIIEKIKSPLSSLITKTNEEKKSEGGILDKFSPALGMIKTGLGVALTAFLVDKYLPQTSKAIKDAIGDAYDSLKPQITSAVTEAAQQTIAKIPGFEKLKEFVRVVEDVDKTIKNLLGNEGASALYSGLLASGIVSFLLKKLGIKGSTAAKLGVGAGGGVALNELSTDGEVSGTETAISAVEGVAATVIAGSAARRLFKKSDDIIDEAGKLKPGPIPLGSVSATPPPSNLPSSRTVNIGDGRAAANDPTKVKENIYQKIKRDTAPKLQAILKKIPTGTFLKIIGTRVGVIAATAMGGAVAMGPLGMILAAISLAFTADLIIDAIDSLYDSLNDYGDNKSRPPASAITPSMQESSTSQPTALAKPGISDQNTPAPAGAPFDLDRYMNTVAQRESGGRLDAKNPLSSASGKFQFLKGTFEGEGGRTGIRDLDPRLQGISFEEFNKREDLQNIAMKILTNMNYDFLKDSLGREPTEEEMYLAHFLGAKGAHNLIKSAEKGEAVSSAVSSRVMQANPNMFPSGSESSAAVLKRITGYYTAGKISKIGEPSSTSLGPVMPFNPDNVSTQIDSATKQIRDQSETVMGSVQASLRGFKDLFEGAFTMGEGKSTSTEFTATGPAPAKDESASPTFSSEKDKLMLFAADKGYYGSR